VMLDQLCRDWERMRSKSYIDSDMASVMLVGRGITVHNHDVRSR
jgi:hypothetical protein